MADNHVAIIQPPRLPYHDAIAERFGVDKSGWRVLCESIWPAARTSDSIVLALSYCKARHLDPFKRNIHIVPIWSGSANNGQGAEVETVWPGIAELRTTAMRTKSYAGMDPPAFGPVITRKFEGQVKVGRGSNAAMKDEIAEVSFPEWCQITVYRMVQGQRVPFPGPRVLWLEFYQRKNRFVELPNDQWAKRPSQMLEKCAEAGALRRAFPEELGEEWTHEEVGFYAGPMGARPVDAEVMTRPPPEPRRSDVPPPDEKPAAENEPPAGAAAASTPPTEPAAGPTAAGGSAPPSPDDETPPERRNWKLDVLGQEAFLKAIDDLLDMTASDAEQDELEAANAERIAKVTGLKRSQLNARFADKRRERKEKQ